MFLGFVFFQANLHAYTVEAESDHIPWSGYWWPTQQGGLATGDDYRGSPSPLEKYDLFAKELIQGSATAYFLEHNYDPSVPQWYGLCSAWAAASVSEHIDFYPSSIDNMIFYVGDKKGLLTYAHEQDWAIARSVTVSNPAIFHNWLNEYIRDKGVAFYADLDPGPEVWNYPVFRFNMNITESYNKLDVTCQIWYADDQVDPDYVGTKERTKIYTYTVDIYKGEIVDGEWTGASIYDHPQKVLYPETQKAQSPYIDYDIIKNIAESKDDYIESDIPVAITPGGYNLILLNKDEYLIMSDPGDEFIINIQKIDEFSEPLSIELTDYSGETLYSGKVDEKITVPVESDNPPYSLIIDRDDYYNGGIYRLDYDISKKFEYVKSKVQTGFGWGGYAICNTGSQRAESVTITGYDKEGGPIETYAGPFSLDPGEKKVFLTSDFKIRNIEASLFKGVKIHSDQNLGIVNLSGSFETNMATFQNNLPANKFVIPDMADFFDFQKSISWGLVNPLMSAQDLKMTLYSTDGNMMDTQNLSMAPQGMVHYKKGDHPFQNDSSNGWILVEADKGVSGYTEWILDGIKKNASLPGLEIGTLFYVPSVSSDSIWQTNFVLINIEDHPSKIVVKLKSSGKTHEEELYLLPNQKISMFVHELFDYVPANDLNDSYLVVESVNQMAGFFSYGTSGDDIYMPFLSLSDFNENLVLAHSAAGSEWWTGITLLNPYNTAASVSLEPVCETGDCPVPLQISLDPESKKVFLVSRLFGSTSGNISYLRINITEGPAIGGAFGFGDKLFKMLSGGRLEE